MPMTTKPPVEAWLVESGWLRRVVRLTGGLEAVIEYDARSVGTGVRPREIVRVDDQEVGTKLAGDLYGKHSRSFRSSCRGGNVSARIEVEFGSFTLPVLHRFRLTVNEAVVYEEAWGRTLRGRRRPLLPLPAEAPAKDGDAYPIASRSPGRIGEVLRLPDSGTAAGREEPEPEGGLP